MTPTHEHARQSRHGPLPAALSLPPATPSAMLAIRSFSRGRGRRGLHRPGVILTLDMLDLCCGSPARFCRAPRRWRADIGPLWLDDLGLCRVSPVVLRRLNPRRRACPVCAAISLAWSWITRGILRARGRRQRGRAAPGLGKRPRGAADPGYVTLTSLFCWIRGGVKVVLRTFGAEPSKIPAKIPEGVARCRCEVC
jgi:hypothetical protein